ncbi:MAG: hypothetical protein ABJF50_06195 [Paracoccaceae bacterium]
MLHRMLFASILCLSGFTAQGGTISVFATGIMPVSDISDGSQTWIWTGNISDQIPDVSGSASFGHFEFSPSDLAMQSFSVGGTEIAFLPPTDALLDSRISLGPDSLSVSIFLDPSDPFFTQVYSNAGFSFSMSGQAFVSDPNDLATLSPLNENGASTVLFLRPEGGSFTSASGTGALTATPEVQAVPLSASSAFLLLGIAGLFGIGRIGLRRRAF